jgi:hypothetical protein
MPTATAVRTAELSLFWIPLTVGGLGNTADCYVMAEDGLNAKAAAVMAGLTIDPTAYVAVGFPRQQPIGFEPSADVKVWNFGTGARARMMAARRAGRIVRRAADLEWWKLAA